MKVGLRLSVIGFRKKVSMTNITIGSKYVECNVDEVFCWMSCDILTCEGAGFL
jgi:hypothetical protein